MIIFFIKKNIFQSIDFQSLFLGVKQLFVVVVVVVVVGMLKKKKKTKKNCLS